MAQANDTSPREAAALPADELASWIVARIEGPTSSRIRAGLLDDIEFAIGVRDHLYGTPVTEDPHRYLSTGCLHGEHGYCQATTGAVGAKKPAECKFCAAPCICPCHRD